MLTCQHTAPLNHADVQCHLVAVTAVLQDDGQTTRHELALDKPATIQQCLYEHFNYHDFGLTNRKEARHTHCHALSVTVPTFSYHSLIILKMFCLKWEGKRFYMVTWLAHIHCRTIYLSVDGLCIISIRNLIMKSHNFVCVTYLLQISDLFQIF